ncbi:obg [Symbiodinium natans]|uniref:Obg protein n=1 Tax=Symbiodinium natans TaxID=878477 RepID=A0A812JV03_9DINO|nr:obg [Symbiodinium natans]
MVQPEEPSEQAPKFVRGELLADLDKPGDSVVVALGGRGGLGNNMARPHEATLGEPGEVRKVELELKMVADIGLVGMPNAGKSTLLGSVSRACPKIAPYPFTTVAPYVGKVHFLDGSSITIADVPGLVEGAHTGAGLGHEFLRHLERTKVLLYVVDCARSSDPFSDFLSLQREVEVFSPSMACKPCAVVATKCDLDPQQTLPKVDNLYRLVKDADAYGRGSPLFVRAISARFGEGVKGLLQELRGILGEHERWLALLDHEADDAFPEPLLSPAGEGGRVYQLLRNRAAPLDLKILEACKSALLDGLPVEEGKADPEGVECTRYTNKEVQAKQVNLLAALVDLIRPLAEKAEAATEELEAHTVQRLKWEAEAERRARTDEPKVDENGEEVPPEPRPSGPDPEKLEGLGFAKGSKMHGLEEALPLASHIWLSEQSLRQEMRGNDGIKGAFEFLERTLALRLRYRHFLRPPLVDVDVLVCSEPEPEKVRLPELYELLSGDINQFSPQNQPGATADVDESGSLTRKRGKHVYVMGQRFDAWENWTAEYPVPIRRLCDFKVAFMSSAPAANRAAPAHAIGIHEPRPSEIDGKVVDPWMGAPYRCAGAGDSSGFEVFEESEEIRQAMLKQLTKSGLITHRVLEVPVDPHPGNSGKQLVPYVFFSVYDERNVWSADGKACKMEATAPVLDDATLLPEAAAEKPKANSEQLLPPWSPLMDSASMSTHHLLDLTAVVTKHLHASPPDASFNALLRADLRQTPGQLQGKPFQSYVMLSAAVEAPCPPFVTRRLRLLRALHSLWKAKTGGDDFFGSEEAAVPVGEDPDQEAGATSPKGRWKRPEIMDRLLELSDCLERTLGDSQGQLFLLSAPDLLEDLCAYVFLTFVWPKICYMQDIAQQHELKERVLHEREKNDISEWSHVLRRVLPFLLRTLEKVQTVDALTLGSAGYALAQLFLQEGDSRNAQKELGCAIIRLERELGKVATAGPQARLDAQTAAALSFDPPSLRPPGFALFSKALASPAEQGTTRNIPRNEEELSPREAMVDVDDATSGDSRQCDSAECSAVQRTSWPIGSVCLAVFMTAGSRLVVHLRHPEAPVRKLRPNEVRDEEPIQASLAGDSSTRLAMSSQEAGVLGRLGENPYLRCLFFVSVASRRPEVASAALGKAVMEADSAVSQERNLWAQQEEELLRQQLGARKNEQFCKELRQHLPVVVARMPGCIHLRLPPLMGGLPPPLVPISHDLDPAPEEYRESIHSKRLGMHSPSQTAMTCTLFGKSAGVGTAVSEMHKDLHGTGFRYAGLELVEVTGLKPNTNYCFATMYFEGFEANRSALSSVSATSPPIGSYYPLPIAILRIKICKAALAAGDMGAQAWKKAWVPLFDSFCERSAPDEEMDSYGLRAFKLRLDVVDRFPPAVLAAFAELVLLRHRLNVSATVAGNGSSFPCTKPAQRAVLQAVNECVLAVDCARRAGSCFLSCQAVSLTMELLANLLCYRTRPQVLFSTLAKCVTCLEAFPLPERQLPWHSKARRMVMYLLHQVTVMSVQLRQVSFLTKALEQDLPERYAANPLADSAEVAQVQKLLLDQAIELALLGSQQWQYAEKKATVALKDSSDKEVLLKLLKDLSDKSYVSLVKEAVTLALREEPERPLFALSLLRSAASRGDPQELSESLSSVLSKHRCCQVLDDRLHRGQEEYKKYGFLLRALPPARLEFPEEVEEDAPADAAAAAEDDEATLKPAEEVPPEAVPPLQLEDVLDSEFLSQLELSRAAALMQDLSGIQRKRHDISRFRFFDLKQVAVPLLSPDGATLGVYEEIEEPPLADDPETAAEEAELTDWQKEEAADKEAQTRAFSILQELLRLLARAAGYAAARNADQLLLASLASALNALLLVAPAPEACVPTGPKSNPMDIDPDQHVGAEEAQAGPEEAKEKEPAEEPATDVWLSLAVMAELAVKAMLRLKGKWAAADPLKAGHDSLAVQKKLEELDEEERAALVAQIAVQELQAVDEELHDVWFEKVPELDVASVAKLVAFSVLCLYHMRRWSNIIVLCRGFNDATCSVYATTFLPLMIGAQKEICNLSNRALANTQRYIAESKATFEVQQKKLPRKLLRQLALQGELSEPEQLFRKRAEYYNAFAKRQKKLHGVWSSLLKALEDSHNLASRAVPAAMEQLRKSRLLLAEFLQDREAFSLAVQRGQLVDGERDMKERPLRLAATALVSSYRKAVELLRKRQMSDQVVQALHELGNLLWLEGDAGGARDAWSDAVDTVFQFPFAIKNWSKCIDASLSPPQDASRVEILLLTVVILSKHARLTKPKDVTSHLNAALFASNIIEAILTTALPNPPRRDQFALGRHRLREIFFGLRETRMILSPSSVHGGVDGANFLGALGFFQNTLLVTDYQPSRCLPICMLYNYVATDVCRNLALAVKGRLMAVHSLIRCCSLTEAWLALHSVSRGYDKPRGLMASEALDIAVAEAQEITAAQPFRCFEEPASASNVQAINQLMELTLTPQGAGAMESEATGAAAYNLRFFKHLKAEFLIAVCSYQRVFPKLNEPQEKDRVALLDKADALLVEIWKEITGNDDDREAWSTASRTSRESGAEEPTLQEPSRPLSEEEGELCAEVRLMRAKVQEGKGDLGKAIQEVLYGMEFLRRLAVAGTKASQDCNLGAASSSRLRAHPGSKCWMRLRSYMVNLLVSQGRLQAAAAHIQQGLEESKVTQHDVARVELLMAKVKMEVLSGRLLELQGERHLGAIPAAECCLAVAARNLPIPTPSAVYARMMLFNMLQQNPSLVQLKRTEDSAEALEATGGAEEEEVDPSEMLLLEAAGSIIISPIAKQLQKENKKGTKKMTFHELQKMLADMVAECLSDVEKLLEVQGVQRAHLHPRNVNSYCDFGPDSCGEEAFKPPADPPLLPEIKARFRELSHNDSREPPNIYLQLMPLRLHCQLELASLRLDLGEMEEAFQLLQDAELCMTRCVYLVPWNYVQFCKLKLRWRKLTYRLGLATTSAPLDAPNAILYRDPKTFATGICPATDSPLYRTFMERVKAPQTVVLSEWVPPYERQPEEGLQLYMQEFMGVAKMILKEGGNDLQQLLELLDEGLEEVLRVEAVLLREPERTPGYQRIYPFFACFSAIAKSRKALLFPGKDAPKGAAGPPAVDLDKLPLRIALDLQRHLQRQAAEGALAYSSSALEAAKKQILYRSMMRHTLALRRECDLFGSLFLDMRLLTDQLHVSLSQCCEAYSKARVLDESTLQLLETPAEVPVGGTIFVRWSQPELRATAAANCLGLAKVLITCRILVMRVCKRGWRIITVWATTM